MPDFVTRLAQRGAGRRASAAPQPTAAPWAAARFGGPADIVTEPEPNRAFHREPPGPAAPLRPTLTEGSLLSAPVAVNEPAPVAGALNPSAVSIGVPREPRPDPLSSQSLDAPPTAPRSRDDPASPAAKAAPAGSPDPHVPPAEVVAVPQMKAEPGRKFAYASASASQPPSSANAVSPTPPRNFPAAIATSGQPVPVVALPQAMRPSIGAMPAAAAPEMRPIQVRIGRVEVRATQPAPAPAQRPPQPGGQGFGAMQLARSWLGRSFY